MTTALSSQAEQTVSCTNCTSSLEASAKFCGDCGAITDLGSGVFQAIYEQRPHTHDGSEVVEPAVALTAAQAQTAVQTDTKVTYDELAMLESYRLAQRSGGDVNWAPTPTPTDNQGNVVSHDVQNSPAPNFAAQAKTTTKQSQVSESLVREMQSLNALLLRERIFLAMHWAIFLGANLLGFYLAHKCYSGFHGDEVTRFVLALTPLTFINAVALACLAPIRGTRREISRVKERMQYLKVQIEYGNLL